MMVAKKLKQLLDTNKIKYVSLTHSPAFTAEDISKSIHVSSDKVAKSVIVKLGDQLVFAIIPGNNKINLEKLKILTKSSDAQLASENDFKHHFSDCEVGAMPPFGHLYGMKVYVDNSLAKDKEIAFNAGTHSEVIKMSYKDYVSLFDPVFGDFVL